MVLVAERVQSGNIQLMNTITITGDYRVKVRFWGITWWSKRGHFEEVRKLPAANAYIDIPGPLYIRISDHGDGNRSLELLVDKLDFAVWSWYGTINDVTPIPVRTSWKGGEVNAIVLFGK